LYKITTALALAGILSGCELGGAWAEGKRELAPAVLVVRQPPADAAVAGLAGGESLLPRPFAPPDGSEARPFPTLRAALEAAPPGALLRVEEGIWRERITIARPVVLLGRGPTRTRLMPEGGMPVVEVRGADHVELYGLSIEGGAVGISYVGGSGHRLENVSFRDSWQAGITGRGAQIFIVGGELAGVGRGKGGRGIDLEGGSLEAHKLILRAAGRRGIVLQGAKGLLVDLDVQNSGLSALQATDGADVRVLRGRFEGQSGAALYAGGARLSVEGAEVRGDEYAVIGFRDAELAISDSKLSDYSVAGVALVGSRGVIQRCRIGGAGTEAAISITGKGSTPVALIDNRIHDTGAMGVHLTNSSVVARGNIVTGTRLDRDKEMGDAFYAIESELQLDRNVLRGNAGNGVTIVRSKVRMSGNDLIGNGRSGVLLLDRSNVTATGNLFERNARAGVELAEQSRATLSRNRFALNPGYDIDAGCGRGSRGVLDLDSDNTFAAPPRQRACE
jgi:hypothetical protein